MSATQQIETVQLDDPVPYAEAYRLQLQYRDEVAQGQRPNTLILLEHSAVFTLGRNAHEEHLLQSRDALKAIGIEVVEADRGGDITYHGPGQLVAYPILDLRQFQPSVDWYLRSLEEVLIGTLASFGIEAGREKGYTGVWTQGAKIAAIGVGIRDWITYHGIALNVAPDMEHFDLIVPCGIPDKPVTSLKMLLGDSCPDLHETMRHFESAFQEVFGKEELNR